MKMKFVLLTSAMMAVGMVGTASAGNGAPTFVECNDPDTALCLDGQEVDVTIKCTGDFSPADGIEIDEHDNYDWDYNVDADGSGINCSTSGLHGALKTEGKCTDQEKGPTKDLPKNKNAGTGPTVEFEIKTSDNGACGG